MEGVPAGPGGTTPVTGVGVLDRVMAILDSVERAPVTSGDLAHELELTLPTVYRLTAAMTTHGLLRRDRAGRHHLGPRLSTVALAQAAGPVLEGMTRDSGESGQVWVQRGRHRYCVASVESSQELRASLPTGAMLPLADGGSAALALTVDLPDPAHPDRRWIESIGQRNAALCAVSAPVTVDGTVVAAVCLSVPIARMDPRGPGRQYGHLVVAAADRLAKLISDVT